MFPWDQDWEEQVEEPQRVDRPGRQHGYPEVHCVWVGRDPGIDAKH